ncbi:alpha/beta hydrolase [soil metagenome]
MKLFTGLLALLAFVLSGCSPLGFVNSFVTQDLLVRRDLAYGDLPRQKLDLYTSATAPARGVVVFIHGGYWDSGDKSEYPFVADSLTEAGFMTIIVNYRLVPDITFPSYAEDVALAVKWVFDNVANYGGDPNEVFLMGHSAGAHIAALVAYDERYLDALGATTKLAGFVGLAGPYDFLPLAPDDVRSKAALGPEDAWAQTQPINFVDGGEPSAFIATGLKDTTVKPGNSLRFAERVETSEGEVELKTYKKLDHVSIAGALGRGTRFLEPQVLKDVLGFLDRHS